MTASLLVELLTEELPPKALKKLGDAFAHGIRDGLMKAALIDGESSVQVFATPRRLGLLAASVRDKAPDRAETKKLMPSKVAFDAEGKPSAALLKRLEKESLGADAVARLERKMEGDAEQVFVTLNLPGATLVSALQSSIEDSIAKLPIPKVMSYQLADGETTVKFVRPAHGLIALHGAQIVPVSVLGLKAGNTSSGHRFQGAKSIAIPSADNYAHRLEAEGKVIADFDERKGRIEKLLLDAAKAAGVSLGDRGGYEALLDEVTALVEFPAIYAGEFETEFLTVPQECLILTMKQNQKYFPLFQTSGKLSHRFLIVSNMTLADPRNVVHGNERVVRPRLSDARFFFETDKKVKLADRVAQLGTVVYHNKLGTQLERAERVAKLAAEVAQLIGADAVKAERAARLAKADLLTNMVGEFPELQGIMGRYYALHDGEPAEVADAVAQHYQPRFSGDELPAHAVALSVALADKLETLAGLFGIGQEPTGDKDPFALRRHALGVIRMLIERDLPLSVTGLVASAMANFPNAAADSRERLTAYLFDRLVGYLREQGYSALEVDAVVSVRPPWGEFPLRLAAVRAFAALPESTSLAAANKRVANILKKSEAGSEAKPEAARMVESAEKALWSALQDTTPKAEALFAANDYAGYLKSFAALKTPVDEFFDKVMVNAEDVGVRNNRLALLRELRDAMNRVADLSKLAA
jgi:glycyl-tRNA synthetase beta chain